MTTTRRPSHLPAHAIKGGDRIRLHPRGAVREVFDTFAINRLDTMVRYLTRTGEVRSARYRNTDPVEIVR